MWQLDLAPEQAIAASRAVLTTALADGELSEGEQRWIRACSVAFGAAGVDPCGLEPLTASELASAILPPIERERVLQAMILTALADEKASAEEADVIETFAKVLEVRDARVLNLRQLAQGQVVRMWVDIARRSFARREFESALRDQGLSGLWKIVGPMIGRARDPQLARRYLDLGALPNDTLGHVYFRFIVDNELGFPGEGVVPESGVWHDLTHVLGGYGIDPAGEVQNVSFIAGYRQEDPFFWLFTIALQFHLGIKVSPYSPGLRGHFDPALVMRAVERGNAVKVDLSEGWDYWKDLELPLEEARSKVGVPPP